MRSTGEVMGISATFGSAVMKAFEATGVTVPRTGKVFLSLNDNDKWICFVYRASNFEFGPGLLVSVRSGFRPS
jgi:hypothetical protein